MFLLLRKLKKYPIYTPLLFLLGYHSSTPSFQVRTCSTRNIFFHEKKLELGLFFALQVDGTILAAKINKQARGKM